MKRFPAGMAVSGAAILMLAAPAGALTGEQTFVVFGAGDDATVVATGPISGVGQDFESQTEEESTFVFPNGSVVADHPSTSEEFDFNPVTCLGTAQFAGTYSLRDGTGAYTGASGTGTYSGRAVFLAERTATGCSETETVFDFFFVRATGTTTLP
jgi:hypothetical protein